LQDPISKIPITKKRAGGVAQGEGPEFNISTEKKNKTKQDFKNKKTAFYISCRLLPPALLSFCLGSFI
jgi:hypothetical protein